jgi:hypothetical protein
MRRARKEIEQVSPPPFQCKSLDGNIYAEADGQPLRRRAAQSAKETPSEMGGSAAGLFGPLLCGLYLQVLSFSIAVTCLSCYQRADNQDW